MNVMATTPSAIFGRSIRIHRRALKMSQTELARKLDDMLDYKFDGSKIVRIEKGERGIRLDEAVFIAKILGVPLEDLLSDKAATLLRITELREEIQRQEARAAATNAEHQEAKAAIVAAENELRQLEHPHDI